MNDTDIHALRDYFEESNDGVEIAPNGGLEAMAFGEFLVVNRAIDRHQLLCALQMQDRSPGSRLGECVAALGYLHAKEVETQLGNWQRVGVVLASA